VILTANSAVRLALLVLVCALLQLSFFAKLSLLGAPDLTAVVVMSLGLLGGSVAGAVSGFALGLLLDVLMLQTLGASSLALLAVGYLAGRYRESFGRPTRGAIALLGGALTLLAVIAFAAIQIGLGVDADVSTLVVRDAVVKSVLGALLALPVFLGVRLMLRPALVDDRPSARRPFASGPITTEAQGV
jgi:rod shape-determining protein MreD